MVQVKIFNYEWDLNDWLEENDDKINVADIKLAVSASNTKNFMVIYRTTPDWMQPQTFNNLKHKDEDVKYFDDYDVALNG